MEPETSLSDSCRSRTRAMVSPKRDQYRDWASDIMGIATARMMRSSTILVAVFLLVFCLGWRVVGDGGFRRSTGLG